MLQEYLSALVVVGLSGLGLGDEGMHAMGAMDTEAMYKAPETPRYEAAKAAAAMSDSLDQVMFAEGETESGRLERVWGVEGEVGRVREGNEFPLGGFL